MTTSITLDPSNLVSISLYLPSFIAVLSLATTLARIATLPLDCAIVARPGQRLICLQSPKSIYHRKVARHHMLFVTFVAFKCKHQKEKTSFLSVIA